MKIYRVSYYYDDCGSGRKQKFFRSKREAERFLTKLYQAARRDDGLTREEYSFAADPEIRQITLDASKAGICNFLNAWCESA